MGKDPDVFILRFEKWAGRGRVVGRKPWSWEGRPEHRNLTISTALEHEELKKKNDDDNVALKDVEDSFNTLQALIQNDDVKDRLHPEGHHLSLTSVHDSQTEATEIDSVMLKDLFQYEPLERKKTPMKSPNPLSSRLTDPSYMKMKSIEFSNSSMESSVKPLSTSIKGYSKVHSNFSCRTLHNDDIDVIVGSNDSSIIHQRI